MWKATTASLILESMKQQDQKWLQEKQEDSAYHLARLSLEAIGRYCQDPEGGISEHLKDIIMKSLEIDQDIGKQAARIDLAFRGSEDPIAFDAGYMETGSREATPHPGQRVDLVVAPALVRQGKSTGEDFEISTLLLKMEVACFRST